MIFLPAIIQVIYAVANDGLRLEIPECPFGKLIAGLFLSNLEVLKSFIWRALISEYNSFSKLLGRTRRRT